MATTLAAAEVFPIAPDGGTVPVLARTFLTNVQPADAGNEVRASLRTVAQRRLEFTVVIANAAELGQFRARWVAAPEKLRFTVPVWPRQAIVTAFPTSTTASGGFAHRDLVVGEHTAILWRSESVWELVDLEEVTDTGVTFASPPSGSYVAGAALLVPVMNAWLDPPTAEQLNADAERVALVFREELPGVAGIDPTAGGAETPVAASVVAERIFVSSPWGPNKSGAIRAIVKDAAGMTIPRAPITWDVTPPLLHDEPTPYTITFPGNGSVLAAEWIGNAFTGISVTVTSGDASTTIELS